MARHSSKTISQALQNTASLAWEALSTAKRRRRGYKADRGSRPIQFLVVKLLVALARQISASQSVRARVGEHDSGAGKKIFTARVHEGKANSSRDWR